MTRRRSILAAEPILLAVILAMGGCSGSGDEPESLGPAAATGANPSRAAQPGPSPRRIDPPAAEGAMAPNLWAAGETVLLSWLEPAETAAGMEHALRFSRLEEGAWTEPITIVERGGFFANWADFPSVVETPGGILYAHWLEKSGKGTYAYDVMLARSEDGGATWRELGPAHDDGTQTEHGFVTMVVEGDGVRAFWLDGRETGGAGHGASHEGAMTLRTGLVGETPGESLLLDDRVCDCCQTSAALTDAGPVVIYRDRSGEEIRDISIVRQVNGRWTEPSPVHVDGWEVPGCPVNGPSVDAAGRDLLAAWHTVPGGEARVRAAFSGDSGASFTDPILIDGDQPLGRVDAVLLSGREGIVSWLSTSGAEPSIRLRRVGADGRVGPVLELAATTEARASGFPRMVRRGDNLIVAWTHAADPASIRAALVPVSSVPAVGLASESGTGAATAGELRPWDADIGSRMPELQAAGLDGEPVTLSAFAGKPVLLNLWATWCAPCVREMPELAALHDSFGPRGLEVIGLSLDQPSQVESVREMASENEIPYQIIQDQEGRGSEIFRVQFLPATFLFDREGRLIWKLNGLVRDDDPELRDAIRRALETLEAGA